MATVLTADILDSCPSGTLAGVYCYLSTYTAISLIEGTYFLTPKGVSPLEGTVSALFTTAKF